MVREGTYILSRGRPRNRSCCMFLKRKSRKSPSEKKMLTLGSLNLGYFLQNLYGPLFSKSPQSSFHYESHMQRKELKNIDSTIFLGSFVLPGIPMAVPEEVSLSLSSTKQSKGELAVLEYDKKVKEEYTLSSLLGCDEPCLQSFYNTSKRNALRILDHAFDNSLALLMTLQDKTFVIENRFPLGGGNSGNHGYQNNAQALDCSLVFDSSGRVDHILVGQQNCGRDPAAAQLALCACFTRLTFQWHLLSSHLLAVQSIYSLAATSLPKTHPLYILLHQHGCQVNTVDLKKGKILVQDNMARDWSFTPQGVEQLFHQWQRNFHLEDLTFLKMAETKGSIWKKAQETWTAIQTYVTQWVQKTDRKDCFDLDTYRFWNELQALPHQVIAPQNNVLNQDNLILFLTQYIYVSIFVHEHVGDQATDIIENSYLWIPILDSASQETRRETRRDTRRDTLLSLERFRLIYLEATKDAYHLNQSTWIETLPSCYQPIARNFQSTMNGIDPRYKLGINS